MFGCLSSGLLHRCTGICRRLLKVGPGALGDVGWLCVLHVDVLQHGAACAGLPGDGGGGYIAAYLPHESAVVLQVIRAVLEVPFFRIRKAVAHRPVQPGIRGSAPSAAKGYFPGAGSGEKNRPYLK